MTGPVKPSYRVILLVLILLFGIIGVTSLYTRMSQTTDEYFHIICGLEWLREGTYNKQPLHPPLARVMDALFLYAVETFYHGKAWTGKTPHDYYIDKMILTRLGTLPFYILSCVLVFVWSRKLYGKTAALFSLALYVSLSTITANAALATTDMAYTAVFLWAIICGIDWLQNPDRKRGLLLGISIGIMIGTKYSGLLQWPASMAMIIIAEGIRNYRKLLPISPIHRKHIVYALLYGFPATILVLGLIFRFSFEPLVNGVKAVRHLNNVNFAIWLFKPLYNRSVWYFFPVVFFFKTPLSFFTAAIIGNERIIRTIRISNSLRHLYPLLAAFGVMLVSMTSHINLGVRHVLPLYPLLAVPAGYGLAWLWSGGMYKRAITICLVFCQYTGFILAYPEQLAYFNILAGDHPEHISMDSDFDWGQDMVLLDEELQQRGITAAYMCERHDAYWNAKFVVHAKILPCPTAPLPGWLVAGRAYLQFHDNIAWLKSYKAVQIGKSTLDLYYFPSEKQ